MNQEDFKKQDEYCRRPGQIGGQDCTGCPGEFDDVCADNIRNLCGSINKKPLELLRLIHDIVNPNENSTDRVIDDLIDSSEIYDDIINA